VVHPEAPLARDALSQGRDRLLVEIFDSTAGGADQVVMVARFTPDVGRYVTRALQPLRQAGAHQPVQGAENGGPADVRMLATDPLVELLGRRFLPRLGQHFGYGEPLWGQPDSGLLKRRLGSSLNHSQMILRGF
jgi:hypothetical protein